MEEELEEDMEDQGGGGGWKWGPRRYIDTDGGKSKLITIVIEPSGPLAYDTGWNFATQL